MHWKTPWEQQCTLKDSVLGLTQYWKSSYMYCTLKIKIFGQDTLAIMSRCTYFTMSYTIYTLKNHCKTPNLWLKIRGAKHIFSRLSIMARCYKKAALNKIYSLVAMKQCVSSEVINPVGKRSNMIISITIVYESAHVPVWKVCTAQPRYWECNFDAF